MPLDLKPMRYAHSEGHTDVCFDDKGRYLITCGSDGDVRVYDGFDDDDPESFRAGETVTAVTFKNDRIITGADNAVQIYKFPGGTPDGIITRFTGSVNHLSYSPSGKYLAAGGSDFNIKVVDVNDSSHKSLKGHEAPILSVAFDPDEEYIASSSCDGMVKLWNWKEQKCLKSLNLLPKSNDISTSKSLCRLAFQPNGKKYLAVPVDKEIKIYERTTWNYVFSLKEGSSSSESVSIAKWSPCGNYLATASLNGEIIIWCINSKSVIERTKHDKSLTISCLVWNPKMNGEIAYTDNQGQLGVCCEVIPCDIKTVVDGKKTTSKIDSTSKMMPDKLIDDDDDFDNASETGSLSGSKKRHRVKNFWFDEEADENDDDDENTTDLGKIKAELAGPMGLEDEDSNQIMNDNNIVSEEAIVIKQPVEMQQPTVIQQPPFQPGSTPAHLMHRFMAWNNVGIVRCHSEEEPSSIDIEFHDTGLHHPMHVVNHMNYTMAALSETVVLLACPAQDELPSKLHCLHFGTWDRSKEWTVSMMQGEDIMAVALGSTWAAVATNQDFLRVFTIGGVQTKLVCLPGAVVSMSGHDNQLFVVYHCGVGAPGHQCLAAKLIDLDTSTQVIADQRLPLSPKANLSWIGFSQEGTPATFDSLGVVRLLNRSLDNTWTPVANTKSQTNRKSDHYWVVGLTESSEQIRCILCTGSTYPPTLPRPLISTLPLHLPVCEVTTEKGKLEENYLRSRLLGNWLEHQKQRGIPVDANVYEQSQTETKQLLMKLFALSCKSDRDFRAKEICELLPDAYSVSLAIKYASRNRHMNLAQRLDELARQKAEEEAAEELDEVEEKEGFYGSDEEIEKRSGERESEREYRRRNKSVPRKLAKRKENGTTRHVDVSEDNPEEEPVDEEEIVDEENDEPMSENKNFISVKSTLSSKYLAPVSNSSQSSYGMTYSQETTRRSNPFKVSSLTSRTINAGNDKGFFDSVEKEKSTLAMKASNKSSPPEKTKKPKEGRQTTLFNKKKPKENKEQNVKTSKQSKPRVSPFQCWLGHIKSFLKEENPELSDGELMKIAMKQWRETPKGEKEIWEKNAKVDGVGEKITNHEEKEMSKKKRKRKDENSGEDSTSKSDEATVAENKNITKKVKTYDKQKASAKLAGFAFNKRE